MKRATKSDQEKVVSILVDAFKDNKSILYIAGKEENKIRFLMSYSFVSCLRNGDVFVSKDGESCALLQFFDKKKFSIREIYWDLRLILKTIGLANVAKVLSREAFIKKHYPKENFTYLWFIGVNPKKQGLGAGTELLKNVLEYSQNLRRPVYLETSTKKNIPWYIQNGFQVYETSDRFGFPFYFLKNG
ncbi:hypothetical protein P872_06185 [Rhodonellum psychrophilum GCM71 = DSM 17998]|uniref:N-acetyltransferase domain-containing protein n=2 Tax=Rhodonellum TaxID=336827 RepID=U5BZR6_9BACT|nr:MULTISPECIES: GNAT family N-acetyltransferase [Rhodonellum]ERM83059.1 hypothetical protein P872_06185 [Rhodonellum psychrophilum GCM71 = DSM 17998]SDZ47248.1 Acetyltransferase (GNAT) family protein [Rhodonellum ikkaensis]